MDPEHEMQEMETNLENMFDHVIEMSNTDMPRDFLAGLSKYFFRDEGEKLSTFQKMQMEACLLLEHRRPHWRKRKTNASSQFLSIFYLLEKEVTESDDEVSKSLFVEAFHSRDSYTEAVMNEFDETDKLEKKMATGHNIKFPGFIFDGDDTNVDESETDVEMSNNFDFDKCVLEVGTIVENLEHVEQSKYVKLFEKEGEQSIGIHITRIKALARRKSDVLTPIPANIKMYPRQVKAATKTFTKMTSSTNVGAANTGAGYCMLINLKDLNSESRSRILNVLGKEDVFPVQNQSEREDDGVSSDEGDLLASQDYPNFYQSQTSDTLLHCTLCEFMSRSKHDFQQHEATHPSCRTCIKQCLSEATLRIHMTEKHPVLKVKCNLCAKEFIESELPDHLKEHERFSNFRKGLESTQKPGKSKPKEKPVAVASKKKSLNCYLLYVDEHRNRIKSENPGLSPVAVTKLLGQMWQTLSVSEKNEYKEKAKALQEIKESVKCPKCENTFENQTLVISHMVSAHLTENEDTAATAALHAPESGAPVRAAPERAAPDQTTLVTCNQCGKLFFSREGLEAHKRNDHGVQAEEEDNAAQCSGVCGGACNGLCTMDVDSVRDEELQGEGVHDEGLPDEGGEIVWAKITSMFWPAKILRKLGELTEIVLYDEEGTKKILQNTKLKPFEPLQKVSSNRSKYWKKAYELATLDFNKLSS